jgi:hypothetical protein
MKIIFPAARNLSAIDLLHFPAECGPPGKVINCDADDNQRGETHFLCFFPHFPPPPHIGVVHGNCKIPIPLPVQSERDKLCDCKFGWQSLVER